MYALNLMESILLRANSYVVDLELLNSTGLRNPADTIHCKAFDVDNRIYSE